MAITTRSRDGRASARYSDGELYSLVRRVAVWVNRRRPTKVTQSDFDIGRAGAKLPDLPSARAICMRLGEEGKSRPWAEVLEIACAEQASPEISQGRRRGSGMANHLGEPHLYFALNLVAQHLGVRSLTPDDYERGCLALLERESRRRTGRHSHQEHLLDELLPNAGQIERIVRAAGKSLTADGATKSDDAKSDEEIAEEVVHGGQGIPTGGADWDVALSIAGLEPRAILAEERNLASRKPNGLPLVEAIHAFVEANDRWPSRPALIRFGELADIAIQQNRDRPWPECLDEARAFRSQLGLSSPTKLPHETRVPLDAIQVPDERIKGAPRRRKTGAGQRTHDELLDALEQFDRDLPAGVDRTRDAYRQFATGTGLPSATTIDRRGGGFTAMMAEMRERRRQRSAS